MLECKDCILVEDTGNCGRGNVSRRQRGRTGGDARPALLPALPSACRGRTCRARPERRAVPLTDTTNCRAPSTSSASSVFSTSHHRKHRELTLRISSTQLTSPDADAYKAKLKINISQSKST